MSKLSNLEKKILAELYQILVPIKNSNTDLSDSIQDFIYNQFKITTDEESTLEQARGHFKIENEAMEKAFDIVSLLVQHFDI